MKVYFILSVAFAVWNVALCDNSSSESMSILQKCQNDTGATKEDLKQILSVDAIPSTRIQFCLVACLHKATGSMDAENKFVLSKTLKQMEPLKEQDPALYQKAVSAFEKCHKTVTANHDECESAKTMILCMAQFIKSK